MRKENRIHSAHVSRNEEKPIMKRKDSLAPTTKDSECPVITLTITAKNLGRVSQKSSTARPSIADAKETPTHGRHLHRTPSQSIIVGHSPVRSKCSSKELCAIYNADSGKDLTNSIEEDRNGATTTVPSARENTIENRHEQRHALVKRPMIPDHSKCNEE